MKYEVIKYYFQNSFSFQKYALNSLPTSEEQEGTVEYLIEMAHYLRK